MLMSVGSSTSSMPVIELTVVPPSLIESFAMCECASMMPGETKRPVTSTTSAPAGTAVSGPPTAAIFPSRMTTVPLRIVPRVTVRTVAPFRATRRGERFGDCPSMRVVSGRKTAAASASADT